LNKIQVEILGISSTPSAGGAFALLLKEVYGQRRLPIIIGQFEAQAIALEMENIKPPRPLTHDLVKNIIDNLGASIQEVYIDELRDNTFFAKIVLEVATLTNEIDSRPSDAIAIAIRSHCPIYVNEEIMITAGFNPSNEEDEEGIQESDDDQLDEEIEQNYQQHPAFSESKMAMLQNQLREAIEKEDYEKAAKLRDEIKKLSEHN
jgi:bifunctional DNase/RNase